MSANRNRHTTQRRQRSGKKWQLAALGAAAALVSAAAVWWNKDTPTPAARSAVPTAAVAPTPAAKPHESTNAYSQPVFPDLDLTLTGITRQGDRTNALISIDGGPARTYRAGEELRGGISIRSIQQDRVVLAYGPATRILVLGTARTTAPAEGLPITANTGIVEAYKKMNPDIDPDQLSSTRIALAKEFLSDVKLTRNPRGGFVVEQVNAESVYGKLGLRPGDVVFSIDTPDTVAIDESSMESVMSQTEIQIEVLRDGRFVMLRHRLD